MAETTTRDRVDRVGRNADGMLDKAFIDTLDTPILRLGSAFYTFRQLVEIGVGNRQAARNLGEKCKRLGIKSPEQLFQVGPTSLLRTDRIGNATMWVAMHVLADHGYSVEEWWGWKPGVTPRFSSYREQARRKAHKRGRHEV